MVKQARIEYGDPDIIQIRKIFSNATSARIWESKVCHRLDVRNKSNWLNLHNGDGNFKCTYHTDETKTKLSKAGKGRKASQETLEKLRKVNLGRTMTKEWREKISKTRKERKIESYWKGKKIPENIIEKMCRDREYISPNREIIKVKNLKKFCKEHELSYENMKRVFNRVHSEHKGWTANPPREKSKGNAKIWGFKFYNKIIIIYSLRDYCKRNNLSLRSMQKIAYKEQLEYKGYTLADESLKGENDTSI